MTIDFTVSNYHFRAYQVFENGGPYSFVQFCALAETRVLLGMSGSVVGAIGAEVLERHVSGVPPGGISRVMNRVFQTPNGPQRLITRYFNNPRAEYPLILVISAKTSVCWVQPDTLFYPTDWAVRLLSLP